MKRYLHAVGAMILVCGLAANGQTGSGSAGANAGAAQGNAGASQDVNQGAQSDDKSSAGSQPGTLPPGLEKREQLPPGLQNRDQLPPGLAKRTNEVTKSYELPNRTGNGVAGTNQFGAGAWASNQFGSTVQGTNQFGAGFGATNQSGGTSAQATGSFRERRTSSGLTPTGRSNGTNSGSFSPTNAQRNARMHDRAVTATDRTLLVNVRQQVAPELRLSTGAWMPVHFTVNAGVVTIIGMVQTIEIKRQIETTVVQVPGVVRVVNELTIGAGDAAVSGTVGISGTTDDALLARVRQTVLPQVQLSGTAQIDFNVQNGTVMIMGQVPNFEEKRRIVALVKQVPGVTGVTDQTLIPLRATGQ